MDLSFHYLLMSCQAMLHKQLLQGLSDTSLTLGQPKVLDFLKEHDGVSQKEVAAGCHIKSASLTSILGLMEEKGMVERKMINGNRRSLYVFLTDYGKELQKAVAREFVLIEESAFDGIAGQEQKAFMDTLIKIYENLQRVH